MFLPVLTPCISSHARISPQIGKVRPSLFLVVPGVQLNAPRAKSTAAISTEEFAQASRCENPQRTAGTRPHAASRL